MAVNCYSGLELGWDHFCCWVIIFVKWMRNRGFIFDKRSFLRIILHLHLHLLLLLLLFYLIYVEIFEMKVKSRNSLISIFARFSSHFGFTLQESFFRDIESNKSKLISASSFAHFNHSLVWGRKKKLHFECSLLFV